MRGGDRRARVTKLGHGDRPAAARRGLGIGRDLVAFAERASRDAGCRGMQLELLVPREWAHPAKQFLAEWYARLGYRVTHRADLAEDYYRKELA